MYYPTISPFIAYIPDVEVAGTQTIPLRGVCLMESASWYVHSVSLAMTTIHKLLYSLMNFVHTRMVIVKWESTWTKSSVGKVVKSNQITNVHVLFKNLHKISPHIK